VTASTDSLYGLSVEAAVEVADGDDPEAVRAALERVADDGVVTVAGVEDAVGDLAGAVSTAETRAELASVALADARETAAPVAHLDAVAGRLDRFASRVGDVEDAVEDLHAALDRLLDGDDAPDPLATGETVRDCARRATRVQTVANELQFDLDDFETWLSDPDVRHDELAGDVGAVDEFLDALSDDATALDGEARWFDATLRHRVAGLLLADLRADLSDLRTWPGADRPVSVGATVERLDAVEDRHAAIGDCLDAAAADAGWPDRFADRLDAAIAALDAHDPPVDWGAVESALADRRPGP
jgi:hypothetical protein